MYDLNTKEALQASVRMRINARRRVEDPDTFREAISIVGGRLAYLNRVSKSRDMLELANHMLRVEKAWLLSQIGLIADCDDDVMDEQKWSSCSWLLLREFVKQYREDERTRQEAIASGNATQEQFEELPLPKIPYVSLLQLSCDWLSYLDHLQYKCRQIMTRTDFLEGM